MISFYRFIFVVESIAQELAIVLLDFKDFLSTHHSRIRRFIYFSIITFDY